MPNRAYTLQEEIGNTITHSLGALICAFLFGVFAHMTFNDKSTLARDIGCCVFGFASMFVFIASSLYHAITHPKIKSTLKLYDHIAIYFLIAGTYIPVVMCSIVTEYPRIGWAFIGFQVIALIAGIWFKTMSKNRYSLVSVLVYCLIGWSVLPIVPILIKTMSSDAMQWLVAGAFAYMIGVPFYVLKQYRWTHTIWHVFVVVGIFFHYLMMFNLV